jgi:hypothetical protein
MDDRFAIAAASVTDSHGHIRSSGLRCNVPDLHIATGKARINESAQLPVSMSITGLITIAFAL